MFWMANALDWNAKPIVLQTFASSTFHGVSRVVDDRLTAFCFEQFMSCNFRHLVTTTHGNLTSVFFLGNGCNDVATMLKFCKALSDLVNLLILRSSGFTRMKVRCILPQAFNQPSQAHDVSVTWTIDTSHTRNPLVLVEQGSLWRGANGKAEQSFDITAWRAQKDANTSFLSIPHVINAMGKKCKVPNFLLYIPCNLTHHSSFSNRMANKNTT